MSATPFAPAPDPASVAAPAPKKLVRRAIGPRLRIVFHVVLALLATISANSLYLAGVTFLQWWTSNTYQDYFYQWMFLLHVILGLLIITPFLIFG
ncbi:MAG: hypothetical protein RLZZ458_87, partial [Planctomycetota bacterium]